MQSERLIQIFTDETISNPMPGATKALQVEGIGKAFGGKTVLQDISFSVFEGESLVLLGASGSGKTTILRVIAGLEVPDKGQVVLHDRNITGLLPRERNVGLIFQDYSLFPRMTTEENISFGLRIRGKSRRETRAVVDRLIELVRLDEHRKKLPSQLSGGQQQRVAIARALAYDPQILLFDEAFAALDTNTRSRVRQEVVALMKEQNVPSIFITHDREEALEIGDRIAVLNNGVLEQIGTPAEIYDSPDTAYVASFIGRANILDGIIKGTAVEIGSTVLPAYRETRAFDQGERVKLVFRPEDASLSRAGLPLTDGQHLGNGIVSEIRFAGSYERIEVRLDVSTAQSNETNPMSRNSFFDLKAHNQHLTVAVTRARSEAATIPLLVGNRVAVGLRTFRVLPTRPTSGL